MKKAYLFMLLILFIGFNKINAQQATLVSGGNATGSGGSVSFSIGQIDYITATGTNGSVSQGLQQPIEISTLSGTQFTQINLQMAVYPNPTTAFVYLKIDHSESFDLEQLAFQLVDINGKEIIYQKIYTSETQISLENLAATIYFLKVSENNKTIKTFKIIKNN